MFTFGFAAVGDLPDVVMVSIRDRHAVSVIAHKPDYTTAAPPLPFPPAGRGAGGG
jgi:hypothetical protein